MPLKEYKAKRKFNNTTEPRGRIGKKDLSRFVVQKHHARSLHYDFRLEIGGVLKSWAVPKGVSRAKGVKRLAVQVEDHPVDYINFSGKIPEGEYGAGEVKIFDKGEWQLVSGDINDNSFKFILYGKKLTGEYILVRLKDKKNWLIYRA